jgi:hypothetical protein
MNSNYSDFPPSAGPKAAPLRSFAKLLGQQNVILFIVLLFVGSATFFLGSYTKEALTAPPEPASVEVAPPSEGQPQHLEES